MMDSAKFKIIIEHQKGSHKSFHLEEDPLWKEYPLQGVTYPVDYGYIEGYEGEDGAELDIFVGSGDKNGYIKVWRVDVAEETKFFMNVTDEEVKNITNAFQSVLIKYEVLDEEVFHVYIESFKKK